jgi:hypothetical protein
MGCRSLWGLVNESRVDLREGAYSHHVLYYIVYRAKRVVRGASWHIKSALGHTATCASYYERSQQKLISNLALGVLTNASLVDLSTPVSIFLISYTIFRNHSSIHGSVLQTAKQRLVLPVLNSNKTPKCLNQTLNSPKQKPQNPNHLNLSLSAPSSKNGCQHTTLSPLHSKSGSQPTRPEPGTSTSLAVGVKKPPSVKTPSSPT